MAIEKEITIKTANGEADGFVYTPSESGNWPGIINLTDLFGIRDSNREDAKRLADEGFVVVMPNIFYRSKKPPIWNEFPFVSGEERSMKHAGFLRGPLTKDAVQSDAKAYADFLLKHPNIKGSKLGVVGYCMTAAHAMFMGAALPDTIVAVAGFHGGGLFTPDPNSPHKVIPQIKAKQYYGHASKDAFMTAEQIEGFEKALKAAHAPATSETYPSLHGWTHSDSAVYNHGDAEKAYAELVKLMKAQLG